MVQSESANDDLLFALVQRVKDLLDLVGPSRLVDLHGEVVRSTILLKVENFFVAGTETILVLELVRDGSGKVLHDCP